MSYPFIFSSQPKSQNNRPKARREDMTMPRRRRRRKEVDKRRPCTTTEIRRRNDPQPPPSPLLPEDLIHDILLRLPVESLVRFMTVQKSWGALFKDPCFTATHANRYHRSQNSYIPAICNFKGSGTRVITLASPKEKRVIADLLLPGESYDYDRHGNSLRFRIVGSCKGVLCLSSRLGTKNCLYNPFMREYKKLPSPQPMLFGELQNFFTSFGFGFDPSTNDLKLVRIHLRELYINHPDSSQFISRADVYTMRTNSWRRMDDPVDGMILDQVCKASVDGFLYWEAAQIEGPAGRRRYIESFDLAHEVFDEIPMPDFVPFPTNTKKIGWSLAVVEESVCLIVSNFKQEEGRDFDFWVMNRNGKNTVSWSWIKKVRVRLERDAGIHRIIGYGKDGLLMVEMKDSPWDQMMIIKTDKYEGEEESEGNFVNVRVPFLKEEIEVVNFRQSLLALNGTKTRSPEDAEWDNVKELCFLLLGMILLLIVLIFLNLYWNGYMGSLKRILVLIPFVGV